VRWSGFGPMGMLKVAIVAALKREVSGLIKGCRRVERDYEGRAFVFFESSEESNGMVVVCGGIGVEAARRAAEAVIALYRPALLQSVGFAGALDASLHVGDLFAPAVVVDARDGSRVEIEGGNKQGTLVTFMAVAGIDQKANLARAYGAHAVDMEASAVATAAHAHGISFAVTKVISDEYDFEMPQTAGFIDSRGQFKTASFALFVVLRPWLWSRVAQLARNSRKAARALGEHLRRIEEERSQISEKVTAPIPAASASRAGGHE
jgi:adenosylhomocysteine nucleosidase